MRTVQDQSLLQHKVQSQAVAQRKHAHSRQHQTTELQEALQLSTGA